MLVKKLKSLVKHGESDTLEFKETTGRLSDALRSICAFLNQEGGIVLFGVTDKGKIIGQEVSDKTKREIAQAIEKIEPHAEVKVEQVKISDNKYVIALTANEGKNKPYTYDNRPYMRRQSTTQKMSRDEYAQLIQENPRLSPGWDSQKNNKCTFNDLDKKLIRNIVHTGISAGRLTDIAAQGNIKEILKKLELAEEDKLTYAAVILFCKKEQKQFTQSEVKLARFLGFDKSEFLDNKIYRGNAFELFEKAMAFLALHLPIAGRIEEGKVQRTETPAIPFKVLREALVNALCHRDYSSYMGSINVAIYDDRVEIDNLGELPKKLRPADLSKAHASYPRNKLIANVFYVCCLIERWGRGTLDMIQLCKEAGNPAPRFKEAMGSFSVVLPLKEILRPFAHTKAKTQTSSPNKLTTRKKEVLKLLKRTPLSRKQIIEKMKNPPSDRMVQLELLALKKLGLIDDQGKTRAVIWTYIGK